MAYRDFKDSPGRTASDKVLHDKAINIAKNSKYYGYQSGIASAVYKFFNKKFAGANTSGDTVKHANKSAVKSEMKPSQQLPEELNKPIVRKLEKQKL